MVSTTRPEFYSYMCRSRSGSSRLSKVSETSKLSMTVAGSMAVSTAVLIRFAHLPGCPVFHAFAERTDESHGKRRPTRSPSRSRLLQQSVKREPQGILGPRGAGLKPLPGRSFRLAAKNPPRSDLRSGFQPLSSLPENVPRRWRSHWLKLAGQAATSYRAAVELKCLDCCAWQRTEARRCEIRGCPLWAVSARIFATLQQVRRPPRAGPGPSPGQSATGAPPGGARER